MMHIKVATENYENWLSQHLRLVPSDLGEKHRLMSEDVFYFLRATYYRWAQHWEVIAGSMQKAPKALAVLDLHIENFGTWRDADGRLVWGINDFDEVYPFAYPHDLVRLIVSAWFACASRKFSIDREGALSAVLDGYARALSDGPDPFVLEENHQWLREIALGDLRQPEKFWEKMQSLPNAENLIRKKVRRLLEEVLPKDCEFAIRHRSAGLGSLGRERFVAVANWHGSLIAREAKALAPSAYLWAAEKRGQKIWYDQVLQKANRVPDPWVASRKGWLIRRLAPHCSKIDYSHLTRKRDEFELLEAMGFETANVHLGTCAKKEIKADFTSKRRRQIKDLAKTMEDLICDDYQNWKSKK